MINTTLISAFAFAFAAQFTEGSAVSGQGCVSAITGSQSNVVATSMAVFHSPGLRQPKQGEPFNVVINVAAFPQPCFPTLAFRPGIKLPAGVTFAATPLVPGGPAVNCFIGVPGGTLTRVTAGCPFQPTATLPDGTLMFDRSTGVWSIPDGQMLQLVIPVMSRSETGFTGSSVRGHVDYVAPDGFRRNPLTPSVGMQVYFNPPSVTYGPPATTAVGPYSAHVAAFVDPHFNAGRIDLELSKVGSPFVVVDTGNHDGSSFSLDVENDLTDLDADTQYQWRYRYFVPRNGETATGATQTFRTLPPPRFAYTPAVTGEGEIVTSPAPETDGTFIDRTVVTLTAEPDAGHRLVSFVVDGRAISGASTSVTIAAALTATATFEEIPVVDPGEGEGEGEGEDPVDPGEGEGEGPVVGEGEGEGEGPVVAEGEGEGEDEDEDEDDAGEAGCSGGAAAPALGLGLVLFRRRRRL